MTRLRSEVGGASAVEFALILPILIVLVFGVLWGGISLNQKLAITQAAREAARLGATFPFPGETPGDDWFNAVEARMVQSATGELGGGAAFCIRLANPDGDDAARFYPSAGDPVAQQIAARNPACTVQDDSGPVGDRARVEVVTARPVRLDFIFYDFSRVVYSDSVARFEPEIDD